MQRSGRISDFISVLDFSCFDPLLLLCSLRRRACLSLHLYQPGYYWLRLRAPDYYLLFCLMTQQLFLLFPLLSDSKVAIAYSSL